jgi:2-polyprenyl-3-methyl-5-hydroxy-6-metoxy-1,4-benzoquinol methylase
MKYKTRPCPWCGEEGYEIVLRGPDRLLELPGEFQLVKCSNCGLIRQDPYLCWEYLKKYYPKEFISFNPQTSEITSLLRRIDRRYGLWKRVNLIEKHQPTGSWLDIGAGTGRILHEASLWDKWDLMGIEPVPYAAQYIEDKLKIPVFKGRFEDFNNYDEYFDIVTMWDVLEHLEEPIEGLRKIRKILRPKGIFVFSTPNMNAWDRKVFQKFWIGYELPRHLFLYPDEVLSKILNELGFRIITKKCIAGSHSTFIHDLKFWNKKLNSKIISYITKFGEDSYLLKMITFLPLWILDQLKLGTNITYLVQKQ